jgi:hypothetical protein
MTLVDTPAAPLDSTSSSCWRRCRWTRPRSEGAAAGCKTRLSSVTSGPVWFLALSLQPSLGKRWSSLVRALPRRFVWINPRGNVIMFPDHRASFPKKGDDESQVFGDYVRAAAGVTWRTPCCKRSGIRGSEIGGFCWRSIRWSRPVAGVLRKARLPMRTISLRL